MTGLIPFASPLAALVVTAIVVLAFRGPARRIGLVDVPGARKAHEGEVPLIGGLAMACGFTIAALTLDQGLTPYRGFFAASAILVAVGVLDDLHELSSRARFAAQIVASGIMIYWGGITLYDLGALNPDGTRFGLGVLDAAFTVFATVGVINALNMCDGLDGLAGSLSLVALTGLGAVAFATGVADDAQVLATLCAAVVGFLLFNIRRGADRPAKIFMGDAGSMFLGFAITWFLIKLTQGEGRSMAPVTALWLLMVPLYDTVWLLIWRPLNRRWPTSAGAEHIHHVLQLAGLGTNATLCAILAAALAGAGFGLWSEHLGIEERYRFYLFLAGFVVYCAVLVCAWTFGGLSQRSKRADDERRAGLERRQADRRTADRRRSADRRNASRRNRTVSRDGERAPP